MADTRAGGPTPEEMNFDSSTLLSCARAWHSCFRLQLYVTLSGYNYFPTKPSTLALPVPIHYYCTLVLVALVVGSLCYVCMKTSGLYMSFGFLAWTKFICKIMLMFYNQTYIFLNSRNHYIGELHQCTIVPLNRDVLV